jgi:tetratricopeptide (TPR) repeat protein
MSTPSRVFLLAAAVFGTAATRYILRSPHPVPGESTVVSTMAAHSARPAEAEIRDRDIEFYERRVARDPEGALDRAKLGALYLQRARETGSPDDLVRAEKIARESFGIRTRKNAIAVNVLASALLGQHRYREALAQVEILVADDPTAVSYRSLLGEIQMELGMYPAAESTFVTLGSLGYQLAVAPRLARWEELRGRPDSARRILLRAREEALKQWNLPSEQKAWFDLRVGDLAMRQGQLRVAEDAFNDGLRISPDDYRILAAMTRLQAARQDWSGAISYGERAIAIVLDPATLGLLGDAYAAAGDSLKAEEYYHAMEVVVLRQPGAYHRAWSLFLLDHDRDVAQVLAKVQKESAQRQDIYGYDLLAWALYKNGRYEEAHQAMQHALVLGTRDAQLFFHNGMIEEARGNPGAARENLRLALSINPYFDPRLTRAARDIETGAWACQRSSREEPAKCQK